MVASSTLLMGAPIGWRIDGTGIAPDANPVLDWSTSRNLLWSTPLEAEGNATPMFLNGRIIVTEEQNKVVSVDAATGEVVWRKEIELTLQDGKLSKTHAVNGYASPSPVSDGESIFVKFGTGDVAALDHDGNVLWSVHTSFPKHGWGTSATPVLVGSRLLIHISDELHSLDAATGEKQWTARTAVSNWGTPFLVRLGDHDALVTTAGELVSAEDGSVLQSGLVKLPYGSPVVADGVVYAIDNEGAVAARLPDSPGGEASRLWHNPLEKPLLDRFYASPIVHEGLLYGVNQQGHLVVLDAGTGTLVYSQKLPFPRGTVYPSPVLAGGRLYVSHEGGKTLTLEPGREYSELAQSSLTHFRATPLFVGDRIYVRTLEALCCIGEAAGT
jgi:outer membrane protein assembly factor BamB